MSFLTLCAPTSKRGQVPEPVSQSSRFGYEDFEVEGVEFRGSGRLLRRKDWQGSPDTPQSREICTENSRKGQSPLV